MTPPRRAARDPDAPAPAPDAPKRRKIKPRKPRARLEPEPIGAEEALREPSDAVVWERVRASYPLEARRVGDAAARGISLADLLALEMGTHTTYKRQAHQADPAGKERVTLLVSAAQSRRAMRALLVAIGPARKKLDRADGYELAAWMIVGTPEWIEHTARHELHPDDEILG